MFIGVIRIEQIWNRGEVLSLSPYISMKAHVKRLLFPFSYIIALIVLQTLEIHALIDRVIMLSRIAL